MSQWAFQLNWIACMKNIRCIYLFIYFLCFHYCFLRAHSHRWQFVLQLLNGGVCVNIEISMYYFIVVVVIFYFTFCVLIRYVWCRSTLISLFRLFFFMNIESIYIVVYFQNYYLWYRLIKMLSVAIKNFDTEWP